MMRINMQIPTGDTLSILVPSFIRVLRCSSCQGNADYKRTATQRDFSWGNGVCSLYLYFFSTGLGGDRTEELNFQI